MLAPDKARVRDDFEINGTAFRSGEWITGHFVWIGGQDLRFETDKFTLLPNAFDRFELSVSTLEETFEIDLGRGAEE